MDDSALRCLIDGELEISNGAEAAEPSSTAAHREATAVVSLPPTLSVSCYVLYEFCFCAYS